MKPIQMYRQYLTDEYERRRQRNPGYSLRAFARDLAIPAPKLSQYLSGIRGLSGKRAAQLAQKIGLSPIEADLFTCSADAANARDPITKQLAQEKLTQLLNGPFSKINMEKFNLVRDWYHLAILELTELEQFQPDIKWIAKKLRISNDQAKIAIERLESLGLLNRDGEKWRQTDQNLETPPDYGSRAIREYHHQMLNLTDHRFEDHALEKREIGSVMFAVDEMLVPEMKQLIRRFQKEAAALVERSAAKNSLYALNFQFLPLIED